jgi:hypothetical protein
MANNNTATEPTTFELVEPDTGSKKTVTMATPSARRRVRFYELENERPTNELNRRIYETMIEAAKEGESEGRSLDDVASMSVDAIMRRALLSNKITIDEALAARRPNPAEKEANVKVTIAQFRLAVDDRQLETGWRERLASEEFLLDQNIAEMEAFVSSFRRAIDG